LLIGQEVIQCLLELIRGELGVNSHRNREAELIYIINLLNNLKRASILFGQLTARTVDLI
jgi:hypothetical protein